MLELKSKEIQIKFAAMPRKVFDHLPTSITRFLLATYGTEIDTPAAVMPQRGSRQQLDVDALRRHAQRGPFMEVS